MHNADLDNVNLEMSSVGYAEQSQKRIPLDHLWILLN
jgi:hypothetical protein